MTEEEINTWSQLNKKVSNKFVIMNESSKKLENITTEYFDGRPVLGKILVLPEASAIKFEYSKPWSAISITTNQGEHPSLNSKNRIDLLQLSFADLSYLSKIKENLFEENHAKYIVDFLKKNWDKSSLLMIHCYAGISRSAAVAQVASEFYQNSYSHHFSNLYSPNKMVVNILRDVFSSQSIV